jgi:hypothetical protein
LRWLNKREFLSHEFSLVYLLAVHLQPEPQPTLHHFKHRVLPTHQSQGYTVFFFFFFFFLNKQAENLLMPNNCRILRLCEINGEYLGILYYVIDFRVFLYSEWYLMSVDEISFTSLIIRIGNPFIYFMPSSII